MAGGRKTLDSTQAVKRIHGGAIGDVIAARLYALYRTQAGCYGNSSDIIIGTKGTCHLGRCRIEGETNW
ncbi:MAG: hypothetical protein PHO07_18440 [Pirellulales bacterium]|jgi:hypothetical protein|nr:hypothetical protein [Pirellulales bacterium]MDI9443184.1 hypothetical protein [Planctomycetota bacterium]NLZ00575.1 hypothetical protein [Pirellulaceae bacterium]